MTDNKRKRLENLSERLNFLNSLWRTEIKEIYELIDESHKLILKDPKLGYSLLRQADQEFEKLESRYRQEMREARCIEEILYKENFR